MGRSKQTHIRKASGSRLAKRDPAKPLRQSRQETFASVFAETLNLQEAVRRAGYRRRPAARIGGQFLASEAMQQRIRYLQRNDPETLDTVKLIQTSYLDARKAVEKAIVQNPFTGEVYFDLLVLTPQEIASLGLKFTGKGGQLGADSVVSLQTPGLTNIAALARIVSAPNYAPERKEKAGIGNLILEIARGNTSAAPINSTLEDDD